MFITEDFVYIHLPKTGGTFVEQALRRLLEQTGDWYLDTSRPDHRAILGTSDQHESVREIPPEHRQKPLVFTIRNPYDWYVSQYEFAWWKVDAEAEFDDSAVRARYSSYPDLSFGEFVVAVNDVSLWPAKDREVATPAERHGDLGLLTSKFIRSLSHSPNAAIAAATERGAAGLRAAVPSEVSYLRTDTLSHDLRDWLIGRGFTPSDVEFILTMHRFGRRAAAKALRPGEQAWIPTNRDLTRQDWAASWSQRYDAGLKAFVRQRDRLVFELFPEFD